jgi:hypothetical protein
LAANLDLFAGVLGGVSGVGGVALVALDGRVDAVAGLDVGTGYVGRLLMLAPPRNGDLWSPRRRLMLLAVRGLTY